jgi:hypothetical protein
VAASHGHQPPWREIYQGGSAQAEQEHFRKLADVIVGVQRENERKSGSQAARRTFHAKIVVGVDNAELAFPADLPPSCPPATSPPARGSRPRSRCPTRAASSSRTAAPTCAARH